MLCPFCRAENPADALQCVKCGADFSLPDAKTLDSGSGSNSAEQATPRRKTTDSVLSPTPGPQITPAPSQGTGVLGSGMLAGMGMPQALEPGSDFGPRYRIEALLGEGGMGTVYKAYDKELDRVVALKMLRPELMMNPELAQRFKQELLLASRISHKNILRIHDLGDVGGVKFFTMAFVEGEDLHQLLKREGRMKAERIAKIARQLCGALEAAHAEGVLHRDLKPHNVLLDASGQVYITDFGLAKSLATGEDVAMTRTGQFLGTPKYMSPEQVEGKELDRRSDLYSLGLIFYELATGDVPFKGTSTLQVMYQRVKETPKNPREIATDLPEYLEKIIMRCLERDPAVRYQSAAEILADFEAQRATSSSASSSYSRTMQINVPMPQTRKGRWLVGVGVVALLLVLALAIPQVRRVAFFWSKGSSTPAPVSVLVADFTNHTGDPIFDDTLEPMVNFALEGASFINAHERGAARKLAQKLPHPTDKLDEQSARLVAVNQGISAVITGELSRRGDTYSVSATALDSVTGNVLAQSEVTAANKDEILLNIPKLVAPIRKALGDMTPESAQIESAAGAFTAANLEAVHQYGLAKKHEAAGEFTEALQSYAKAAELDPNFARAYGGLSAISGNLGKLQDAEKYVKLAMEHVDRMTERERYRTRGLYYFTMGDWQKCVDEYSELVSRFPADNLGEYHLSGCFMGMRNIPKAVEAARRAVEIAPKSALLRLNLSFYSSYGGDFQRGEQEARAALELHASPFAYLALAESQLGQEQMSQAAETYHKQEQLDPLGNSMASSGLADLAQYEGRFADAVRILEQGAANDLAAKNPENAADKLAALAHVQLMRGQKAAAVAAAEKAVANSQAVQVKILAAQAFVEAGELAKAQKLAASLGAELTVEPQSYAKIIEGMIALKRGETRQAIAALADATKLFDTWISRFELGQAYLEAGLFVEASSEFDRCIKRRGEAIELFMNNVPTVGYFPMVYYYQGRVREGLKSPGFAEPYRTYLSIRGKSTEDPLLPEIRNRIGK